MGDELKQRKSRHEYSQTCPGHEACENNAYLWVPGIIPTSRAALPAIEIGSIFEVC